MIKKLVFTMILTLILSMFASADIAEQNWAADFYGILNSRATEFSSIEGMLDSRPEKLEYERWFNDLFIKVFEDSLPSFTSSELEKIAYVMKAKPDYEGTGKSYGVFFKTYMKYLYEFGFSFTSSEKESLEILIKAKPDKEGSQKYYVLFVEEFEKILRSFEPSLTSSEKEFLYMVTIIRPLSDENGYTRWSEMYEKFYTAYGPTYTGTEEEILNLILSVKPEVTQEDGQDEYLKVKKTDLERLRIHIRKKENLNALKLLDYIMAE